MVAVELPKVDKNLSKIKKEYWKNIGQMQKQTCKPGVMKEFNKKLKDYRGSGFYLPIINNRIYSDVFPEMISELKEKISWLEKTIKRLKALKRLPRVSDELELIQKKINQSLELQEKIERFDKTLTTEESKKHEESLVILKKAFAQFLDKAFYLGRYVETIDHFENRMNHDSYYSKSSRRDKIKQKKIFLKRKILEDGAPGDSHSGSDKFFRTTLDTLKIKVPKIEKWLTEDMRYDLEYALDIAKRMTKVKPSHYRQRFEKWLTQTKEQLDFYEDLYNKSRNKSKDLSTLLGNKQRATTALKVFVTNQQLKTYLFWSKQSPLMRSLYALETILFNEVGGVDPTGLERKDVLQVVLNRYKKAYYRRLKKSQRLYKLISSKNISRTEYPWLNILFNRGEFSFTLYYFKASHETFCPSMGKKLMKLRRENLDIALDILKDPNWDFNAERYFSRASMTGRIDMSQIWNNFNELDQRPGKKISSYRSNSLSGNLKRGQYRYLYKFKFNEKSHFVVEIHKKIYVFTGDSRKKQWFEWRNPHYFRYFAVK